MQHNPVSFLQIGDNSLSPKINNFIKINGAWYKKAHFMGCINTEEKFYHSGQLLTD